MAEDSKGAGRCENACAETGGSRTTQGGIDVDVQRKKGILEVCVLAVLKKGPSYGYMIIRELERCIEISESTLYPILKRLEQNGSLKTYRQEYNGRMRKYYQLMPEGQHKIDTFLDEWDELQKMYQFVEEQNQIQPLPAEETAQPEAGTEAEADTEAEPERAERTEVEDRPEGISEMGRKEEAL